MKTPNRREFLFGSGMFLGLAANAVASDMPLPRAAQTPAAMTPGEESEAHPALQGKDGLYNTNIRTAIGLGDEPASTVDKYGQLLWTRRAVCSKVQFGSPLQTAENAEWRQSLLDGYLPVVETDLKLGGSSLQMSAFAADYGGVKADYLEIRHPATPYRVELLFPYTTDIAVHEGTVISGDKILAAFPRPTKYSVKRAKYNLLTPESWSTLHPAWHGYVARRLPPGVDDAFATSREAYLNRSIEYRFPVQAGRTYHVVLGLYPQPVAARRTEDALTECPQIPFPGWTLLRLSVNSESQQVDYALVPTAQPVLREFVVTPRESELRVKSECDPSSTGWIRGCEVSGIWIFDVPVESRFVVTGALNSQALYYVQCGRESVGDMASSVVLDYEPNPGGGSCWIRLPYDTTTANRAALARISPAAARDGEKIRWESLLRGGAEFTTGIAHLDNLYRTSLINILLMRRKYGRQGEKGEDIYVVVPGPNIYDVFWTRDGSFMTSALDLAGLPQEAEKSLRLFWHPNLTGTLAEWGQQASGAWASPIWQWDGQGQALMALLNHYELTGDQEWLKRVYPNIRKGAIWIKQRTELTQFVNERGEKPIYYGLLPMGSGEGAGTPPGFIYHPNYWAVYGVRLAIRAARALSQTDDEAWMADLDAQYSANLLASIKLAYRGLGQNKFIPVTPFIPEPGGVVALYPTRFLAPTDPMMDGSLRALDGEIRENTYGGNYHTFIVALSHLLANDVSMFWRLFNGYVAMASPTNGWVETVFAHHRAGSGDMPHCWAAALYITAYRASLVYENEGTLEFCWGVQPAWLRDGARISVRRAPTKFGKLDFTLQRAGHELAFDYSLKPMGSQTTAEAIRFHIPNTERPIASVRVNGRRHRVTPGESVITL
jgi:hypothetical protein